MREIRFRAWDKIEERMCSVDVLSFGGEGCFLFGNSPQDWEIQGKVILRSADGDKGHFVNFENLILMQYTGLRDKNGKEIYEGDIVQTGLYGKTNASISFHKGRFVLFLSRPYSPSTEIWGDISDVTMEIIGNIYENLELLTPAPKKA